MMNRKLRSVIWAAGVASLLTWALPLTSPANEKADVDPGSREKIVLCSDGKHHYIAIAPDEHITHQMFYGDGKRFVRVPRPSNMLTGLHFLDPRVSNKTANPNFRGLDMRLFSWVDYDAEKQSCALTCGERKTKLTIVETAPAQALLSKAKFEENPQQYKPYALARDDRGSYYYVERGSTPQNEHSFRMYLGTKGNMKLQKMTNVVSDSEGDIFATATGSLRMILDKRESSWIENEKSRKLTIVPWEQNLGVIYNDLGIYHGQPLGTPCDDL